MNDLTLLSELMINFENNVMYVYLWQTSCIVREFFSQKNSCIIKKEEDKLTIHNNNKYILIRKLIFSN